MVSGPGLLMCPLLCLLHTLSSGCSREKSNTRLYQIALAIADSQSVCECERVGGRGASRTN